MKAKTKSILLQAGWLKEGVILTAGVAIAAAAVYFFLCQARHRSAAFRGLRLILANFVPLSISAITMILNVALLILGVYHLRKSLWREDGIHQHYAAGVSGCV